VFHHQYSQWKTPAAWRKSPQRRPVRGLQNERVDDLVEPVGPPHRDAGRDHIPAAAFDLVRVDVDHERQQRDRVPLEQVRVTDLPQGLQRGVCPRGQ
jgi:hypothetical protein